MEVKEFETKLAGIETALNTFIAKHAEEVKLNGTATAETKAALLKLSEDWNKANAEQSARLLALEQKATGPRGGDSADEEKSFGQLVIESEGYKMLQKGAPRTGAIKVGSFNKTALVNAIGQNQPLVPADRAPGITFAAQRRLTVSDLLPHFPTQSNSVEFVKETAFTNNAAPQYSAAAYENVTKAESAFTFSLTPMPVSTVAHWIPVSRQLLDDAPGIQAYINSRLLYGLKLKEEDELLNGSGIQGHLSGLVTNATAYDTAYYNAADTYVDTVRNAITQVQVSELEPDAVILNPKDWAIIEKTKETGSGISSGMYVFANPKALSSPVIWGLNVVATNSMTEGQFLVGAFRMGAAVWDRMDATVEISREHSDYFVKNMAAILCEERLAQTVFRPAAFIYGAFPFGS